MLLQIASPALGRSRRRFSEADADLAASIGLGPARVVEDLDRGRHRPHRWRQLTVVSTSLVTGAGADRLRQ